MTAEIVPFNGDDGAPDRETVQAPLYAWKACSVRRTPKHGWGLYASIGQEPFNLLDWSETHAPMYSWTPQMGTAASAGFHCFNTPEAAYDYAGQFVAPVVAKVELQGEVVEHEHGYRAEKFRIHELMCPLKTEEERSRLVDVLGWPFDIGHHEGLPLDSWRSTFHDNERPRRPNAPTYGYVEIYIPGSERVYEEVERMNGIKSRVLVSSGAKPVTMTKDVAEGIRYLEGDPIGVQVNWRGGDRPDGPITLKELREMLPAIEMERKIYELKVVEHNLACQEWDANWEFDPSVLPEQLDLGI